MLKKYRIIKRISSKINKAAETVAQSVLNDFANIEGREEEITAQLRGELNRRFLDLVSQHLDGKTINDCYIKIATLKRSEETKVGADIAGVIEIIQGANSISKAFLAQSKVGSTFVRKGGQTFVSTSSKDLLRQTNDMLAMSSDSFIFIYSRAGISCVPAFQVKLGNSNKIDTEKYPSHKFGIFFEEFFKCFIGDHLISPSALNAQNLEDYADKLKAQSILKLSVILKDTTTKENGT